MLVRLPLWLLFVISLFQVLPDSERLCSCETEDTTVTWRGQCGAGDHSSYQQGQVTQADCPSTSALHSPSGPIGSKAAAEGKDLNWLRLVFHTWKNETSKQKLNSVVKIEVYIGKSQFVAWESGLPTHTTFKWLRLHIIWPWFYEEDKSIMVAFH